MEKREKKLILLSILVSLIIHILVFLGLLFINKKPQEEKEKIITLTLENLPKEETKPSLSEKEPIEKNIEKKITEHEIKPKVIKPEVIKPQVIPKTQPQQEKNNQQTTEKQEEPKTNTTPNNQENQETKPPPQPSTKSENQEKQETKQTTENKPTNIDLSKGRPDSFKQPEKKDIDIDGYLKELIKYLNEQAREKDLYPPLAKRLKMEGQVIIRVTINEDGTINEDSIKIVDSSGYNVLDKGAIEILKKLQPYKKPPKKITVEIPIVFQIIYMNTMQ